MTSVRQVVVCNDHLGEYAVRFLVTGEAGDVWSFVIYAPPGDRR